MTKAERDQIIQDLDKEPCVREIREIARDIHFTWVDKNGSPAKARWCAKPYLDAMFTLKTMDENYGLDTAVSVVLYFLANAAQFKGPDARRLKTELWAQLPKRHQ